MGFMEHFLLLPFSLPISEKFKNAHAQEENGEFFVQISCIVGTPPPSPLIKGGDEIFEKGWGRFSINGEGGVAEKEHTVKIGGMLEFFYCHKYETDIAIL